MNSKKIKNSIKEMQSRIDTQTKYFEGITEVLDLIKDAPLESLLAIESAANDPVFDYKDKVVNTKALENAINNFKQKLKMLIEQNSE